MLFVKNELSYDSFQKNADSIYRISLFENYAKDDQHFNSITPAQLGPTLKAYYPEINNTVRISKFSGLLKIDNKSFTEDYHLADKNFFSLFNFPLVKGEPASVLTNPNSVVLTESYAKKFFGNENAIGQIISITLDDTAENFTVTGIAKNVPSNSSIQFNIIIPFQNIKFLFNENVLNSWTNIVCETYVFTRKGVTGKQMDAKMPLMVKSIEGSNYKAGTYNLLFQPIKDIHLDTKFPVGFEPISSPVYSYVLSIIGFFILLIASINFITLSIGRSVSRAGEVGIRKVIGANKLQLIKQFWGESLLLVIISAVLAGLISELLLPFFNNIAGKNLKLIYDPLTIIMLLLLVSITGLAAGFYPAIILSSYKPAEVLKGKFNINKKSNLRRALVCGQFALSVILITGTIVVSSQLNFIRSKSLGFNKQNVVIIPTKIGIKETFRTSELFKNELRSDNNVIDVSAATNPLGGKWCLVGFDMPGGSYGRFYMNTVDYDYVKTMKMKMVKGRDFSRSFSTDEDNAVIVNEAFIKQFGLQNDIDGKMPGNFTNIKIIGIVKNFNFESLHSNIKPALIALNFRPIFRAANDIDPHFSPRIIVRIKSGNTEETLKKLKNIWAKVVPQISFESSFLNENINNQYKTEERLTTIITSSSLLSILITCLGLFGLTTLITIQKTKEIGIRRLLGASAGSIFRLLSKEFLWLIVAAQIISLPVAWYLLNRWLDGFAYRINISISMLIIAGLITIAISMITISFQAIKSATANPIKSLRNE
jgi:putative ABC transport system permease protein